jgi:hypothetical protein
MMTSSVFLALMLSTAGADFRWAPFLGCWSLVEDEIRLPVIGDLEAGEPAEDRPMGLLCLAPEGNGVRLTTYSGEEVFLEESLSADGQRNDVVQGRCHGWQQVDWSSDASILFTRSELTCEENRKRSVSGVSLLLDGSTWIEIQSMGTGDGRAVLIRRFRAASAEVSQLRIPSLTEEQIQESGQARLRATSKLTLDDVIEASSHVAPEVVEALLVERGGRFALDGESLVRLSDASVPPRVIDLMVALSFPDEFAVERAEGGGSGGMGWGYSGYDPYFDSAFAYPYYAAPFGYYYWYAPWRPIYGEIPDEDVSVGRAVEGRGYTRVTRVAPVDSGELRAHRRGESGGSDSGSSSDSGSQGSSGGSVSQHGYSRGGGEGATARPKKQ